MLGLLAEDAQAQAVERADGDPGGGTGQELGQPVAKLLCGPSGERDRQAPFRLGPAGVDQVRDPPGQRACLAGSRPGHHQERTIRRLRRGPLVRIQPVRRLFDPGRRRRHGWRRRGRR